MEYNTIIENNKSNNEKIKNMIDLMKNHNLNEIMLKIKCLKDENALINENFNKSISIFKRIMSK
tara:strand:- start:474 stop:665 length:192 start_codon:yes stop_codon:yes gene_type:complete